MKLARKLKKQSKARELSQLVIQHADDHDDGAPWGIDRGTVIRYLTRATTATHQQLAKLINDSLRETTHGSLVRALSQWYALGLAHPTQPTILFYMALAAYSTRHGAEALQLATDLMERALQLIPYEMAQFRADAAYNLGRFHEEAKREDEAIAAYLHAVQCWPEHGQSLNNLGSLYFGRGDYAIAMRCYEGALKAPQANADAKYNIAFLKLTMGQLADGFSDYESRWDCAAFAMEYRRDWMQTAPRWDGSPLHGKRLFVCWEQGFGDTLMMWRYIDALHRRVGSFHVEVQPALYDLLAANAPAGVTVSKAGDPLPRFDTWTTLMSLPHHFCGGIPTWEGAYIVPNHPERRAA